MKVTQCELVQELNRKRKMICWLSGWEHEYKLKLGLVINLDDDDKNVDWIISKIFTTQDHHEIRRCWGVGGL